MVLVGRGHAAPVLAQVEHLRVDADPVEVSGGDGQTLGKKLGITFRNCQ